METVLAFNACYLSSMTTNRCTCRPFLGIGVSLDRERDPNQVKFERLHQSAASIPPLAAELPTRGADRPSRSREGGRPPTVDPVHDVLRQSDFAHGTAPR
jgi:hypothetical protein